MNFSPAQAEASQFAAQFVAGKAERKELKYGNGTWLPSFMRRFIPTRKFFINKHDANSKELLIWAVTGAGKTEVIFHAIKHALDRGFHILIATPRKDVVLELAPRFQKAFPSQKIIVLHGDSKKKGENGQLVIATTHQAINFYRNFDLVVVDEVDAFPYHNQPMLEMAVQRARTKEGQTIYLTATPPQNLLQRVRFGLAESIRIPCRHHGYPLIVPRLNLDSELNKKLNQRILPESIKRFVQLLLQKERQGFIFVPKIDLVNPLVEMIRSSFNEGRGATDWIDGTFANDKSRNQKVKAFREGSIRMIVTTTILERGVTIPGTDCLVCMADAAIFDESSLVQIAGRVGRSKDDPNGQVIFVSRYRTNAIVKAIRQIKEMNREARRKGYLREG